MNGPASRRERLAATRLYVIASPHALGPGWETAVDRACRTGCVGAVQLRAKDATGDQVLRWTETLRAICARRDVLLLLNDDPVLAATLGVDGAHVGQGDEPPTAARRHLGPDALLGLSTHGPGEIARAHDEPVDYVGLGPCFPTRSKALERPPQGPDLVRRALPVAGALPVFPIGGITLETAPSLVAAGAARLAVGEGILGQPDPAAAAERLFGLLATRTPH